jgi:ankyrin repeat protein
MIRPPDIEDDNWGIMVGAATGDAPTLHRLLEGDPTLSRRGYFYTPPIHFAVREGHAEIVQALLDAGADSEWNGYYGESLIEMARERGHDAVAATLERARDRQGRTPPAETPQDHPIHLAAETGDLRRVRELLEADPHLVNRGDHAGGTPLHRAVIGKARNVVALLLERGANVHAIHGAGLGSASGFSPHDVQAIDLAIWGGRRRSVRPPRWRVLLARLRYWMKIQEARPNGRRPLTTAVEFGHETIARFLLDRGANPTWPELGAEKGGALHAAARAGDRAMVELLLSRGADPNAHVDSAGSAVCAAKTPEIRALLEAHGGSLDPYDLVWKDEDDEVMRRVTADPKSAELGCGGVFTAVVTRGKRDLLRRLLDAGIRVPPLVTGCQSYLMERPDMLRTLLGSGMNPDACNWQMQTMLHLCCRGDGSGRPDRISLECAAMLLDAGANISARDDDCCSTPLGWAARHNRPDMVEFLLARGARTNLPDDRPWATPLAWAKRRGHTQVAEMLVRAGAKG